MTIQHPVRAATRDVKKDKSISIDASSLPKAAPSSRPGIPSPLGLSLVADAASPGIKGENGVLAGPSIPYLIIAKSSSGEKFEWVREGLRPSFVKRMAQDLAMEQATLTDHLGFPRSTFTRKAKQDDALSSADSATALGLARIVGEIRRMLDESGDPEAMLDFNVEAWTGRWLQQPVAALGNKRPLDYLGNTFGQETVLQLIGQMRSGAFA